MAGGSAVFWSCLGPAVLRGAKHGFYSTTAEGVQAHEAKPALQAYEAKPALQAYEAKPALQAYQKRKFLMQLCMRGSRRSYACADPRRSYACADPRGSRVAGCGSRARAEREREQQREQEFRTLGANKPFPPLTLMYRYMCVHIHICSLKNWSYVFPTMTATTCLHIASCTNDFCVSFVILQIC